MLIIFIYYGIPDISKNKSVCKLRRSHVMFWNHSRFPACQTGLVHIQAQCNLDRDSYKLVVQTFFWSDLK